MYSVAVAVGMLITRRKSVYTDRYFMLGQYWNEPKLERSGCKTVYRVERREEEAEKETVLHVLRFTFAAVSCSQSRSLAALAHVYNYFSDFKI